jgi:N6-L-threonylcarbamoyladenine synthase
MKILSIETSCDETAISLVEATGSFPDATYEVLGDALWSQVDIHREYGGVFPALAKREHAAIIVTMLERCLGEADTLIESKQEIGESLKTDIEHILEREPGLADRLLGFAQQYEPVQIDALAVTAGPGLEPALWVGVNFARALALLWDIPVIPINHMEGHVLASIFDADRDEQLSDIAFPALSLLISGGHTELIHMKNWGSYEKIGQTRDDAVGEAYDKVARLLGLGYPGGPEIATQAEQARKAKLEPYAQLPRPMLHSGDLDFSFSGLKTAVRYAVAEKELTDTEMKALARDFEDVVAEVLLKKCHLAIQQTSAQTLIVGGGVSANRYLKQQFDTYFHEHEPTVTVYFPRPGLSTDNSIMIALAGHARADQALAPRGASAIRADGNKSLSNQ